MRSISPMPGNPWPHGMVITVEDRPSTLLELLWVHEAHDLRFDVTDLPPILIDTPAAPRGRTLAPAERAAWEQAWPGVWRAASQHAGRDDAPEQFERLERTAVGSPERQKVLDDLVGPDWRDEFGDAVFDNDSYQEWSQRSTDAQLSSMRQRTAESPEHRDPDALIRAWRAGLTKIVTVPCRGEYSRKISGNALLMTDATRAVSTSYRRALAAFG